MTEYGDLSNLHIALDDRKDPGVYYFTLRERGEEEEEGGGEEGRGGKEEGREQERERGRAKGREKKARRD